MKAGRYAAVVLAAGLSQRMKQFKPLLKIGDETIADHLMSAFLQNGVDVYLVVGHRQRELRAGIRTRSMCIVENPDYRCGMFTSVRAGIRALEGDYRAAFIAPVDIPLVSPDTVRRLVEAADKNPGKVVNPTFLSRRGHPPLVPAEMFAEITGYRGDGGLKVVLGGHRDLAVDVDVPDPNILFDLDDPADYQELLRRYKEPGAGVEMKPDTL